MKSTTAIKAEKKGFDTAELADVATRFRGNIKQGHPLVLKAEELEEVNGMGSGRQGETT